MGPETDQNMKIYFTGHRTFGNRGCEALVRSTVSLIRKAEPHAEFLVPSSDIERDSAQWPEAAQYGVEFVPFYGPRHNRYWVHSQRLPFPFLKRAGWPFPFPRSLRTTMDSADAVLSIGGDNYSLDYRLPSLLMGMDQLARDLGKPNILWGASVGPFEKEPAFVPKIKGHLAGFDQVAVRELVSSNYLRDELGLQNVLEMVDPAFALVKEPVETEAFWPTRPASGVLGLNVSPLIERYKGEDQELVSEIIAFVRYVVSEYDLNVLLVPHVVPLDGAIKNNDAHYMEKIYNATADVRPAVSMMPCHLNAAQTKYVISSLRFFIGARTHATIATLSSAVPTVSISYSIKARGINRDLFGHEGLVLPTPSVTTRTLSEKLQYLFDNEGSVRVRLAATVSSWQNQLDDVTAHVVGEIGS